ncbi:MAG: hypothetical protein AB1757_13820 [Acidobacteriota bacterium]
MQEKEILTNSNVLPFQPDLPNVSVNQIKKGTTTRKAPLPSKKSQILELFKSGLTEIGEIAEKVSTKPSYVASVLQSAGLISGYFDLYTTTALEQNLYSRFFRNALSFKNVQAAKDSVARIAALYDYFGRLGDRAGQHHAEVLALIGRNRARFSGKLAEARVFEDWLFHHWNTHQAHEETFLKEAV